MNKHGQSIIEYSLIAILVILGVVNMGPYILRSISAHFKLWDVGVQDSFEENMVQAPVSVVPNISVNCTYNNIIGACGSANANSQCGPNQVTIIHNTNPQGCDGEPASFCQTDPNCCSQWTFVSCGTVPTGQTPASNNCNIGNALLSENCGSGAPSYECVPGSGQPYNCPVPSCQGQVTDTSTLCPGSTITGLDNFYPNTCVNSEAACNTTPCEYYCTGGTICSGGTCVPPPPPIEYCKAATFGLYNFLGTQIGVVTFPATPYNQPSSPVTNCDTAHGVFGPCSISGDCSSKGTWTNSQGTLVEYAPNFTETWTICGISPKECGRS